MHLLALDHVALYVRDLERSIEFYRDVLELQPLPRPEFDFPGAWFHLGGGQQLHLLGDRTEELAAGTHGSRRNHYAVRVPSMADVVALLERKGVPFRGPKPRPDGVPQLFLEDPDGYWMEVNEY
jgi:catechol 2,3-dioxygenase-like lactoylglutathione lyase family enzyme